MSILGKEQAFIFNIFIMLICILLFPLMCFIALFFHKILRKEKEGASVMKLTDLLEKYMFPQSQVLLCSKIGKSSYGLVYKGYAHKILPHENESMVAIKVVKGNESDSYETEKVYFEQKLIA